jgi:sulfate adenylyltransferase
MSWTNSEYLLDDITLCDLECILDGTFAPLNTFMNKRDWNSVLETMTLENGHFFPLPVTLSIPKTEFTEKKFTRGTCVFLCNCAHLPIAQLIIDEYFSPELQYECEHAYGTFSSNHPYVKYKLSQGDCYYVSGELTKINDVPHYDFKELRRSPEQMKQYIGDNNWQTVIGFQTRNPMHRSHFELTKYALKQIEKENPKLLLQPVVGVTQNDDVPYYLRVQCYQEILKYYPRDTVCLSLLNLSMRMAGPKEALFHALIRRNYGCTHFIVGRDHAGPSTKKQNGESFYGLYDAQKLLRHNAERIGIIPICSTEVIYNGDDSRYYPASEFPEGGQKLFLSGTELRRKLRNGQDIPHWFSFPEVVEILKSGTKKRGICFYFIGLSCSGKTTHANELRCAIKKKYPEKEITMLDGDEIRNHISKGLGFSRADKSTNVRRIGWVASEIVKHGGIVICSNIAPYQSDREYNRTLVQNTGGHYIEIFVDTKLEICESRDVKGLYKRVRMGEISNFPGIDEEFETPILAEYTVSQNDVDYSKLLGELT